MASPATCFVSKPQSGYCRGVSPIEASCSSHLSQSMDLLLTLLLLSLPLLLSLYVYRRIKTVKADSQSQTLGKSSVSTLRISLSHLTTDEKLQTQKPHSTPSVQSLLVELLPSHSPNWGALFSPASGFADPVDTGSGLGEEGGNNDGEGGIKRKKKRNKKKKHDLSDALANLNLADGLDGRSVEKEELGGKNRELIFLYPFTSSSSATQRKIKQQYDELVKSHRSKGLRMEQVSRFLNCLADTRNELKHKSDIIQRKLSITRALLQKANRSSFDRLQQQLCRLEMEQKRLEEDAFVYNWLQHQLKLSPAYKKMLEISASMELKSKSQKLIENPDTETGNISFEEFLAQEKKDSFWQKHGKLRTAST